MIAQHPDQREFNVVLDSGTTVHVRPIRRDDEHRLVRFFRGLSEESLARRFFTLSVDVVAAARHETTADPRRVFRLVGLMGRGDRITADAAYYVLDTDRAEVALVIADEYQSHGLGTILLRRLAEVAAANQIRELEGHVEPDNQRALRLLRRVGFRIAVRSAPGPLYVTFPTDRETRRSSPGR